MAQNFVAGALAGVVVAGIGAGAISVLMGPVFSPRPQVTETVAAAAVPPTAAAPDPLPQGGPRDSASPQAASPGIPEPVSGAEQVSGLADTASTGRPETGEVADLRPAPAGEAGEDIAAVPDSPVVPSQPGAQPARPEADELSISNNPAQPSVPAVEEAGPQLGAAAPASEEMPPLPEPEAPVAAPETAPETASERDAALALADSGRDHDLTAARPAAPPRASEQGPQPGVAPAGSALPAAPAAEPPAPQIAATPEAPAGAQSSLAPVPAPEPAPPAVPERLVETDKAPAVERPQVSSLIAEGDDAGRPQIGTPAGTLTDRAPEVTVNRLPGGEAPAASAAPRLETGRPITQFAEPAAVDPDKPMMSIVLIDDGSTPLGLAALEAFPYPITFAVDTGWDGAGAAMRRYREAGFEVMALANLPAGARPQDAEVSLGSALAAVPEAVAVLEGDSGGLQESRAISDQVADILAESGHGLVLYPKGLNTGEAIAARAGVPSAVLFRDFDSKGQSATVIRRFLDQAAFKAGQEGAVIMLGRLRPETISALLIWGLADRASRVSFVPVSQVLLPDGAKG